MDTAEAQDSHIHHPLLPPGYANVVRVGGLRIGGMSGIFKGGDYHRGHHERPPYDPSTLRSCYHWRDLEAFRMKKVCGGRWMVGGGRWVV